MLKHKLAFSLFNKREPVGCRHGSRVCLCAFKSVLKFPPLNLLHRSILFIIIRSTGISGTRSTNQMDFASLERLLRWGLRGGEVSPDGNVHCPMRTMPIHRFDTRGCSHRLISHLLRRHSHNNDPLDGSSLGPCERPHPCAMPTLLKRILPTSLLLCLPPYA